MSPPLRGVVVPQVELSLRIAVAALAGLMLGLERDVGGHPAGMRTHLLVSVGACLFTIAGAYGFAQTQTQNGDPSRVAAQVASGIGFLGAGTIVRSGGSIRGLTTAATLWISGALGVAAGAGIYLPLALCLAVVITSLTALSVTQPLLRRIAPASRQVSLVYERGSGTLGPLLRGLTDLHGRMDGLILEDDVLGVGLRRVSLDLRVRDRQGLDDLLTAISARPEVRDLVVR